MMYPQGAATARPGFGPYGAGGTGSVASAASPVPGGGAAGGLKMAGDMMGGVGSVVGGLASAYGAYKSAELAEEQFKEDKRRYEEEVWRMREMDDITKRQMALGNTATFQQFAENKGKDFQDTYGSYNQRIGR